VRGGMALLWTFSEISFEYKDSGEVCLRTASPLPNLRRIEPQGLPGALELMMKFARIKFQPGPDFSEWNRPVKIGIKFAAQIIA
jgi:hypothetical protein